MIGQVFAMYLKTPNNEWYLTIPKISIIQNFIDMTIQYESLDITKTWIAYDIYNELQMNGTNSLLEWEESHNSPNRINIEMEIREQ